MRPRQRRYPGARPRPSTRSSKRSPRAPGRHELKLRVDATLRDRAANGHYAWTFDRGQDFSAGIWVIDPVFMLDAVREQLAEADMTLARDERHFAGTRLDDDELRDAAEDDRQRRAAERARHAKPAPATLASATTFAPPCATPPTISCHALREIVCRLLCAQHPDVIAYGAGWTDPARQEPVGDSGRHEPRHVDAIVAAELERALGESDPLRGIAQLVARWAAAFALDPDGVTRTKTLGTERMARKLRDALPGADQPLRAAGWAFLRPMLSPRLTALNRDDFVHDAGIESTVDLAAYHADANLDELDLGDDRPEGA